jgi:hypothetical protein
MKINLQRAAWGLPIAALLLSLTGCTSLLSPMSGIPVGQLPPELLGQRRSDMIPVPMAMLRQKPPKEYVIGPKDILGIYIEGVLPPKAGEDAVPAAPPVHFPEPGSDLPPSVGYPIPVRDDGTLPLPLLNAPLQVEGKTIGEVEAMVRKAYVQDQKIIREGRDRILVSVMRERTYRVIVIREDGAGQDLAVAGGQMLRGEAGEIVTGTTRTGSGFTLDMPAYKNDLMHALAETGGLPGLNAKNHIKIIKASALPSDQRADIMMNMFQPNGGLMGVAGCGTCGNVNQGSVVAPCPEYIDPTAIIVPLRVPPGQQPTVNPEDIVLGDGDIVYIETRDTEFFYTGGLLPGGQFPLPRDYDVNVIGAMSIAGQGLGGQKSVQGAGNIGALLGGGFGGAAPTQLFIIRKTCCGQDVNISVDLSSAMNNQCERILIQPGDTLILRYKPHEEVLNFSLVAFFTWGVRELFN